MTSENVDFSKESVNRERVIVGAPYMDGLVELEFNKPKDEILASREPNFGPARLAESDVFCGDKGNPLEQNKIYLHWLGGILKPVHDMTVMQEITEPGIVTNSMEQEAASLTPVYLTAGKVKGGVHSDNVHEHGETFNTDNPEGDIGCKYALLRQQISALIEERGEEIIDMAITKLPELFRSPEDETFAREVVAAQSRLAHRDSFYTSGRRVALAAVASGAKTQVLDRTPIPGDENTVGIINKDPNSALYNIGANKAGTPAYTQDHGALMEAHGNVNHLFRYDIHQVEIASAIDTIGTLLALGIPEDKIAVRHAA